MESKGTVSLWLGQATNLDALRSVLRVSFTTEGDCLGSEFSRQFKLGHYDDDFQEMLYLDNTSKDIDALRYKGFSHGDVVIPKFRDILSPHVLVEGFNAIVLLYDFEYTGQVTQMSVEGVTLRFCGKVVYRKNAA